MSYLVKYYNSKRYNHKKVKINKSLKLKNKIFIRKSIENLPRILNGKIIFFTFEEGKMTYTIKALNEKTFKECWSIQYQVDKAFSNFCLYKDNLYFGYRSNIYIIDIESGNILKKYVSPNFGTSEFLVVNDNVISIYKEDGNYYLCNFNFKNNQILWEHQIESGISEFAATDDYVTVFDFSVLKIIDFKTGKMLHAFDVNELGRYTDLFTDTDYPGKLYGYPIIIDDAVIAGVAANHIISFNCKTGKLNWDTNLKYLSNPMNILPSGYCYYPDGNIYFISASDYFCIDAKTGKIEKQEEIIKEMKKNKISTFTGYTSASDDHVFFFDTNRSDGSSLAALNKKTFKIDWCTKLDGNISMPNAPIITENGLYITDIVGNLYCFRS